MGTRSRGSLGSGYSSKHIEFEYVAVLSAVAFEIGPVYYSRPNQELSLLSWTL